MARGLSSSGAATTWRVTGLTPELAAGAPGDLYAALPGARAHGAAYAGRRRGGRGGGGAHRPGRREPRGPTRRPGPGGGAAARGRSATWPPGSTATRPSALTLVGRHRHPGQDHDDPARRGRAPGGRRTPSAVIGTVGTRIDGDGREDRADHAGGTRPARAVRGDARARRHGLRDGGLQPRPGDGAGRRRGLRRGRLHQPRPRPPRLPRGRRGLLRGEGLALHAGAGAPRPGQPRRRATAGGCSTRPSIPMRTFSAAGDDADWRAVRRRASRPTARRFTVAGPDGDALRGGRAAGRRLQRGQRALRDRRARGRPGSTRQRSPPASPTVAGVPGRLERVDVGQGCLAVVDYAHKPDAVTAALEALRPLTSGRLIVVIGAGGDRDPGKRPLMGEIAARLCRRARGHRRQPAHRGPGRDPGRGARRRARRRDAAEVRRGRDRREAIALAVRQAGPATPSWSPARGTRPARRSPAWCTPSTTAQVLREELRPVIAR